ncbi:MAG: hypothetical protein LBQ84_04290 [Flavobacteriaceae bacterium]|jgi:hypothetical protein|nr:hypothetical protein [Flavobacteriaceae bacterium]
MEKYYLVPVFYTLMILAYRYSKGKFKVKEGKEEQYNNWVKTYGKGVSKSIIILAIIYTIGMIFQITVNIN